MTSPRNDTKRLQPKKPSDYQSEKKYIVFESQLLELFDKCPECASDSFGEVVSVQGTLVKIHQRCTVCDAERIWDSQPYIRKMPVGNLLLSGAILVSGSLPSQALRMLNFLNVAVISRVTYHEHQTRYTIPAVLGCWTDEQASVLEAVRQLDGGLHIAGDGRSDSPGHSAKYGGYNALELRLNKVIDIQLVQVSTIDLSTVKIYLERPANWPKCGMVFWHLSHKQVFTVQGKVYRDSGVETTVNR